MREVFTTRSAALPAPRYAVAGWSILSQTTENAPHRVNGRGATPGGWISRCDKHFSRLAEVMRDLRHMDAVAADDMVDWLAALTLKNYSPKTIYDYGRGVAPLLRSHPGKRACDFTTADIEAELIKVPPKSRHITRAIYSSWFKWLTRKKRIVVNPVLDVEELREPKRAAPDFFTDADRSLLEGLPMPDGPLWTILFGTGARRGDARKLQRRAVDLDRRRVTFHNGKGGVTGVVPATAAVVAAVADLDLFEQLQPADHLWYRPRYRVGDRRRRGPGPIADTTFDSWYRDGIEQAGVRYLSPHKTRHTFGHWLKRQRDGRGGLIFDLEDRAKLMRHVKSDTTAKYYPTVSTEDLINRFAELEL